METSHFGWHRFFGIVQLKKRNCCRRKEIHFCFRAEFSSRRLVEELHDGFRLELFQHLLVGAHVSRLHRRRAGPLPHQHDEQVRPWRWPTLLLLADSYHPEVCLKELEGKRLSNVKGMRYSRYGARSRDNKDNWLDMWSEMVDLLLAECLPDR